MSKWEMVRLGDVCNPKQWKTISTSDLTESGYPVYGANGKIGFHKEYTHEKETILVTCRGATCGAINVCEPYSYVNGNAMALGDLNADCYLGFLAAYLRLRGFNDVITGSAQPQIIRSNIEKIRIPLPPLEVQQQIADTLDKVFALISQRKQQLEQLDLLVKSQFVEMFGESRNNSKHWQTVALNSLADVGSSKRVFVEELQTSGVPFFRGTEIGVLATGEKIIPELYITAEHYEALKDVTGVPVVGDLLMPSICPDGRIWLVDTDKPFYFKDGRVLWVHLNSEDVNSTYLLYVLKDKIMVDYESIASGTTFAELKIFALKALQVMLPPLPLQNAFADFVCQVDKSKFEIQQGLKQLELQYSALMQQYFG